MGKGASLVTLTFDLLTLKVVSESRVTWVTSVPILAVGLLRPLSSRLRPDVRDRQTDRRQADNTKASLIAPAY